MHDPYAPHADFIRPAWRAIDPWRIGVMVAVFELLFSASPQIFAALLWSDAAVASFYAGTSAFGTLTQLASFGVTSAGFIVALRWLHGRGFWSLIGSPLAAWQDLKLAAYGVGAILLFQELLPPWIAASDLHEVRNFSVWVMLLPVAVFVLVIQVTTEEIFFRGYLQQQFACLSQRRWVWMGIPSVLFGVVHYWNGIGVADGVLWAVWAALLGLACADLTARTGTLGAAIGLHLANNAFALLLVGIEGQPASGLALFVYPSETIEQFDYGVEALLTPWIIVQLLIMTLSVLIMWLAARIALRR